MTIIDIHEFSTGINVQGTPENWWSTSFSGHYMNSTLPEIPKAVRSDIGFDLFALSESAIQKTPAIIGREVRSNNEEWSVLAVITLGYDEGKRGISVTRYFLTEGLGKIGDLWFWYFQESKKRELVFDPFDKREEGMANKYDTETTPTSLNVLQSYQDVLNKTILPMGKNYTGLVINELAVHKRQYNQLITWAYNVEGLKRPQDFQVIYPASSEAATTIEKDLNKPIRSFGIEGENEIHQIIKNWMYDASLKPKDVETINQALKNPQLYNEEFWSQSIFNKLGIENATNSYAPMFVRLYMLQGLILKQKLPDFLEWLSQKEEQKHYQIAQEFSKEIQQILSAITPPMQGGDGGVQEIKNQALKGINLIISGLTISDSDRLKNWLILDQRGLWGKAYNEYKVALWKDIEKIAADYQTAKRNLRLEVSKTMNEKYIHETLSHRESNSPYKPENPDILSTQPWEDISKDIIDLIRYKNYKSNKHYLPLAQFFEEIADENAQESIDYFLAAFFYQMAEGDVPTPLWDKYGFNRRRNQHELCPGFWIKRRLTEQEQLYKSVIENIEIIWNFWFGERQEKVSNFQLLIYILTIGIISSIITEFFPIKPVNSLISAGNSVKDFVTELWAEKQFSDNISHPLQEIVTYFDQAQNGDGKKVDQDQTKKQIAQIITRDSNLKFDDMDQNKKQWIPAIKKYQKNNSQYKIQQNGVIKDETDKLLRCQLIKDLKIVTIDKDNIVKQCKQYGVSLTLTPIPTPFNSQNAHDQQWKTIVNSLNKLKYVLINDNKELSKKVTDNTHKELSKEEVETAILKVLTNKHYPSYSYENSKPNTKLWTQTIKDFQNQNSIDSSSGVIDTETYKRLKCETAKKLEITLNKPPEGCGS